MYKHLKLGHLYLSFTYSLKRKTLFFNKAIDHTIFELDISDPIMFINKKDFDYYSNYNLYFLSIKTLTMFYKNEYHLNKQLIQFKTLHV